MKYNVGLFISYHLQEWSLEALDSFFKMTKHISLWQVVKQQHLYRPCNLNSKLCITTYAADQELEISLMNLKLDYKELINLLCIGSGETWQWGMARNLSYIYIGS